MENEELIQEIKDVCSDYMGIKITDKKAKEILDEHPTIRKFGADDTQERSNILDFVCLDICNMKVPLYGNTKEYKQKFQKGIIENAAIKGYELNEEDWNENSEYE